MEDFINDNNVEVEKENRPSTFKPPRLQSVSDLKSEANYLTNKTNSLSCMMEATNGKISKHERKSRTGNQRTSQDKTPIKPSSNHRRSQSLVANEEKGDFIEEMRRNSEEFDKIFNEIFISELEDELHGNFDDHLPAVYIQKPVNKRRKWLRKLLSFKTKPVIDDKYHLQKSSSMEAIFHNNTNVNNNVIRRESFDVLPYQNNNEKNIFIMCDPNKEKAKIVDPVANYFEQDFTTHTNDFSQDEESIIELGEKPFYQPVTPSKVDQETITSHCMKLELEHFYDRKNGQILGIGMPFVILKEMGTNNICLGLQGPKRMDSSVIIDSLLIVLGSFIFPPLLLIAIPFAIHKIYRYYKKKRKEEKLSRYLVFDYHTCRIEKRLYTSGNRTICYRGIIPKEATTSSPIPNRVTYYHESSPENTLVYKNIPIGKLPHTDEKIEFIDFSEISSFDIEKEGNGNEFDEMYFVCCVLQNGKRIRLNNEETNSIDISFRKVRQLKAALEKSKVSAKTNLMSRGKQCDIVRDFVCEEGIFCKAFGYEDVSNIINVKDKVLECLNYVKDQASDNITVHHSICCQSVYKHKQFKSPGLEDLCVTVEGQECTIPDDCFDYRVVKTTNSILDLIKCETIVSGSSSTNDDSKQTEVSPKDAFTKLLSQYKGRKNLFIILLGVTTNSCVKTSAMNMTDLGFNVIIPLDCVACRKSTEPSATSFLKKTPSVSTVSSWTDLFANN